MNELLTLQLDVHGGQKRGARPALDVDDEEVVPGVIENVVDVFWSQRARHPIDAPFHLIRFTLPTLRKKYGLNQTYKGS